MRAHERPDRQARRKPSPSRRRSGGSPRTFSRATLRQLALAVFAIIAFIAVFAPWIAPTDPYDLAQVSVLDSHMPPGTEAFDGRVFWLGTDGAGRDLVSAICYGLQHQSRRRRDERRHRHGHRLRRRPDGRLFRRARRYAHHAHRRYPAELPLHPGGAGAAGGARQGRGQDPDRARDRAVGLLRADGACERAGRAFEGIYRRRLLPRAQPPADPVPPPAAQLSCRR